jgi:hypothetical protein
LFKAVGLEELADAPIVQRYVASLLPARPVK